MRLAKKLASAIILLPLSSFGQDDGGYKYSAKEPALNEAIYKYSELTVIKGYGLGDLLTLPVEEIDEIDIGVLNAIAAQGLPGGESIDLFQALKTLDDWAARAKAETERHFYKFEEDPEQFNDSEAYFRMLVLATVLQEDFGIQYAADKAIAPLPVGELADTRDFYKDSSDIFIHGILSEDRTGTCASLPVLLTAVGRRLDYPLYLVSAKAHAFTRWDDPETGERLNIEYHGKGMSIHPDEYYYEWPYPMTQEEIDTGFFMQNMKPHEELAVFMLHRGLVLEQSERHQEAQIAYARGSELMPDHPHYQTYILEAVKKVYPHVVQADTTHPYESPYYSKLQSQKQEIASLTSLEINQNYNLGIALLSKKQELEILRQYVSQLQSKMGMSPYEGELDETRHFHSSHKMPVNFSYEARNLDRARTSKMQELQNLQN